MTDGSERKVRLSGTIYPDVPSDASDANDIHALMGRRDWSSSPLGRPDTWPPALHTTVRLLLASKFPMFLAWGPDLGFLYNDAYAQILGAKHPDALGSRFIDIWAEIWPDIFPLIEKAMSGEAIWVENLPLSMNRNGYEEEAFFTFSYSPAYDDQGEIRGIFCAVTETTGQVKAELALRESEARFRNVADNSPVMMWVTDPTGYCTYLNRHWYEFTGQSKAEGEGHGWLEVAHPDDKEMAKQVFLDANAKQEGFRVEYRLRRADGVYRWAIDTAAPRFTEDGVYVGYVGSVIDIDERREAEEHLRLLVNELNHRVKNSLSTVQAIAAQTFRSGAPLDQVERQFTGRVLALARAHDILTEANWSGASMREVILRTVSPHLEDGRDRFQIAGPHLRLSPKTALSLSMAIHELCTNATKYGALSVEGGRVAIDWKTKRDAAGLRLHMRWQEMDGPPVAPPKEKGFGSRLIEYGLAAELGGEVAIAYEPEGVICTINAYVPDL